MTQLPSYPKPFKAQVVQGCLKPGVSMTSVAFRHGINANLVRKWIPAYRDRHEFDLVRTHERAQSVCLSERCSDSAADTRASETTQLLLHKWASV